MKLVIGYPCPPIPTRKFDVSCTDENYDITGFDGETGQPTSDYPIGYGPTEFDAIVEFVRELLLRNDDAQELMATIEGFGANAEYQAKLHWHTCQQCDKVLSKYECDCDNPKEMNWCSPNCYKAWQL